MERFIVDLEISIVIVGSQLDTDLVRRRDEPPRLGNAKDETLPLTGRCTDRIAQVDPHAGGGIVHGPRPDLVGRRTLEVDLQQHAGDRPCVGALWQDKG